MVTKKAATKVTTKSAVLKFNPEWIKDPPPPFFRNLDRAAQRELKQANEDLRLLKDLVEERKHTSQ